MTLLAGAVALAAAFSFSGLGFHNDDYALLLSLEKGRFFADFAGLFWARPLTLLVYPALHAVFGTHPFPYHLLLRLLDLAIAWGFYRWLRAEGLDERISLLAALLTALYPNHDAARVWLGGLVAQASLASTIWSLVLYRSGRTLLGSAAFLASMLLYEGPSLLWLCVPLLTRRVPWPLLGAFGAGALWQRLAVPLFLAAERHPMSLSVSHAFKVLGAGFECTFANRLLHIIARGAQYAAGTFSPLEWALWALAGTAIGVTAWRLAKGSECPKAAPALPLAVSIFLLGYAPYFFDKSYMPTAFAANNRLNLAASLGGALFFAWLSTRWRKGGPALAAVLSAAFLLANWASNSQYSRAYALQQDILEALEKAVPSDARTVFAWGFEERVGAAVVFESTFDLDGALKLRGAPYDAKVGQGRTRFDEDSAVLLWYGEARYPYAGFYAYDHSKRSAVPIRNASEGWKFLDDRRR